jgi:hypothetical protein
VRNVAWQLTHELNASVELFSRVGVSGFARSYSQWLYPLSIDPRVGYQPENGGGSLAPVNMRYLVWVVTSLYIRVHPAVTLSVGTSTFHGQLGADGKRRVPGLNRFTELNFDVELPWDGLISVLTG